VVDRPVPKSGERECADIGELRVDHVLRSGGFIRDRDVRWDLDRPLERSRVDVGQGPPVGLLNASSIGDVTGVACATRTACTLLPSSLINFELVTSHIEDWNGHSLRAVRAPRLTGGQLDLVSVAVVAGISDGFQVAVGSGSFTTVPLARTAIAMHD
jgi:hypothetical protein